MVRKPAAPGEPDANPTVDDVFVTVEETAQPIIRPGQPIPPTPPAASSPGSS